MVSDASCATSCSSPSCVFVFSSCVYSSSPSCGSACSSFVPSVPPRSRFRSHCPHCRRRSSSWGFQGHPAGHLNEPAAPPLVRLLQHAVGLLLRKLSLPAAALARVRLHATSPSAAAHRNFAGLPSGRHLHCPRSLEHQARQCVQQQEGSYQIVVVECRQSSTPAVWPPCRDPLALELPRASWVCHPTRSEAAVFSLCPQNLVSGRD